MRAILACLFAIVLGAAPADAAALRSIVVSGGSNPELPNGGDYFPKGCNGNIYKLVEKTIDAYVVKTYMFIAAHAPALVVGQN